MAYIAKTRIGIPVHPFKDDIVKTASGRIRLAGSALLTGDEQAMVKITFKGRDYANVPVLRALAALYIDQIIGGLDFTRPEGFLTISYKRDPERPQSYIGVFALELDRLTVDFSMITDPSIRKRVETAAARIALSIETSPFFIPDEEVDMIGDAGILQLLGKAKDAAETLMKLREPRDKILSRVADELELRLNKPNFLRTQFLMKSDALIQRMIGNSEQA